MLKEGARLVRKSSENQKPSENVFGMLNQRVEGRAVTVRIKNKQGRRRKGGQKEVVSTEDLEREMAPKGG